MVMTYSEQLNDIRWHKIRFEVLFRDNYQCQICRTGDNLNVHHLFYIYGRMAWEYDKALLITLCEKHHKIEHDSLKLLHEHHIKEQLTSGMLGFDILTKIAVNEPVMF